MSEKLPIGGFEWCSLTKEDIDNYDEQSEEGYFVSVDAEIPPHLHDYLNCYPPMPEKTTITPDMTSYSTRRIKKRRYGAEKAMGQKSTKLCATFYPKKGYKLHIRLLKLYLSLGIHIYILCYFNKLPF